MKDESNLVRLGRRGIKKGRAKKGKNRRPRGHVSGWWLSLVAGERGNKKNGEWNKTGVGPN